MLARLIALLGAIALIAGCGGERTYTAEEFVSELRAGGMPVSLSESFYSAEGGADSHPLLIAEEEEAGAGDAHGHEAMTLVVFDDAEGAKAEHAGCSQTDVIICFRAANVVLEASGLTPSEIAEIESIFVGLATG